MEEIERDYSPYTQLQIPTESTDYSWQDKVRALATQNITGLQKLSMPSYGYVADPEYQFGDKDTLNLLNKNQIPTEKWDKYSDATSLHEVEKRIANDKFTQKQAEIVDSMGVGGIVSSFAFGAIDPAGWAIGGIAGKAAQSISNIAKLGNQGIRVTQAGAGLVGGAGSYYGLEYSLDNEASDIGLAVSSILGASIGYATAGGLLNKNVVTALDNMETNGVEVNHYEKIDFMIKALHSDADKLKTSNNPLARELGYKASRTMKDVEQLDNTANDYLADYNQILTEFKQEFDNFRSDYKKQYGTKFTEADEKEVMKTIHKIDFEYSKIKDEMYNNEVAIKIKEQQDSINAEYDAKVKEVDSLPDGFSLGKKIQSLTEKKDKAQKLINQQKDTLKNYNSVKKQVSEANKVVKATESEIKTITKQIDKLNKQHSKSSGQAKRKITLEKKKLNAKLTDLKSKASDAQAELKSKQDKFTKYENLKEKNKGLNTKGLEAEIKKTEAELKGLNKQNTANRKAIDSINKERTKKLNETSKYKPVDDELKAINDSIIAKAGAKVDELISKADIKYQPLINTIRNTTSKYGKEIKEADLHGLKDMDNNFYFTRAYDTDRIIANEEAARNAFNKAILANFKQLDDKTEKFAREQADRIVDNIIKAKADYNALDADVSVIKEQQIKLAGKFGALKGRKLKLDASELVEFMNPDMVHTMSSYSRRTGGELALKKSFGVDENYKFEQLAIDRNLTGDDRAWAANTIDRIKGTSEIDPNSNSKLAKAVRGFNQINYLNFGGWFGANTMTDLSNIVNDFGFTRAMKYATMDVVNAVKGHPESKKLARTLGLAAESLTHDRAIMMGGETLGQGSAYLGEKQLSKMGMLMSKLNGMNMTIDFMDRVVSMSSLDYILTAGINSSKFAKNMRRLGLTLDEVKTLRNSNIANIGVDGLSNIKLSKAGPLEYKLERALKRATRDTVLRANEIDTPTFVTDLFGKTLSKAIFQFMRFPIVAYNKLGVKMANNFDAIDATLSTATAATILTLVNQMKDIGREQPRFDLTTEEGQKNNIIYNLERIPSLSLISLPQNYVDILGRIGSSAIGEDYKGRPSVNVGITGQRINDLARTGSNLLSMKPTKNDILTASSFMPFGNLMYLQPLNNMFRDEVRDTKPVAKSRITKEDIERYLKGNE